MSNKLLKKQLFVLFVVFFFAFFDPLNSSPQAFFQGKLKISGNMSLAMKLQNLQVAPGKAKL